MANTLIYTTKYNLLNNLNDILYENNFTSSLTNGIYDTTGGSIDFNNNSFTQLDIDQAYQIKNFFKTFNYPVLDPKCKISTINYSPFSKKNVISPKHKSDNPCSHIINYDKKTGFFYFQRITGSTLKPKRFIEISAAPTFHNVLPSNNPTISIFDKPDAVYNSNNDTLYFLNFSNAKSIFPDIISLFKKATDNEVSDFLNSDFLNSKLELDSVGTLNRRRISYITSKKLKFTDTEKKDLDTYIQRYTKLEFKKNKFTINTDKDLKYLIYGIDERFYTTRITKQSRLANSVQNI